VDFESAGGREHVVLGGVGIAEAFAVPAAPTRTDGARTTPAERAPAALPATFSLGERHYRRSEESWHDAGEPRAAVSVALDAGRVLALSVLIEPSHRLFVGEGTVNPLDNEPAAVNGDGVQLYLAGGRVGGAWMLVPRADSSGVWVTPLTGWGHGLDVEARWEPTASGYRLEARIPLPPDVGLVALDVLVNETAPGRARRRGQLVLSGAEGEFVYLRGDRHDPHRLLRFTISDV
jgi:hypothetical protein